MTDRPDENGRVVAAVRWSRSVALVVVLGLFGLPFLTVGCVPAQFGSQAAGGSTTYSGYQLALGLDPSRERETLLPVQESLPDRIGFQPLALLALALVVAALVASFVVNDPRTRRRVVLALAAAAALAVVVAVLVARSALVGLLTEQLGDQDLGEGRVPSDFVGSGPGYLLSLALLLLVVVGEGLALLVGSRRARREPLTREADPGAPAAGR